MGASTCAFGSHRCTENIGSFTINPAIVMIHAIGSRLNSYGNDIIINRGIWAVSEVR